MADVRAFNVPPGPFLNENVARGLPASSPFQAGISDGDNGQAEIIGDLPWYLSPGSTYEDYQCWIDYELDSGMVVHRYLPQSAYEADTLGSAEVNQEGFSELTTGVNLHSHGTFADTAQRMANSRYRFCLRGYAIRAGYVPTIPTMKFIGTEGNYVAVIPDDTMPQKVQGPIVMGSNFGIPMYFAAWRLWYTIASQPKVPSLAPDNLSEGIGQVAPPKGVNLPISTPDPDAVRSAPRGSVL